MRWRWEEKRFLVLCFIVSFQQKQGNGRKGKRQCLKQSCGPCVLIKAEVSAPDPGPNQGWDIFFFKQMGVGFNC